MAVPTKRRTSRRQSANAVPVCSCKPVGDGPPCTAALAAKLSHNEIIAADLLYFQLLQALPHRHLAVVRDFTRTRRPHQFESHWSSKQVRSPNASIFTLNRSQITRSQQRRQVYQLKLCSLRQMTKTFLSTTNRYHHMLQHKCRTMPTTHKLQRCQTQTNIEVALKV